MASVLVPIAYIIIVFGGLSIFSYFYRKHTSSQVYEPYFPSHPERNAYVTLLQKTNPSTSDTLLKSALVRRAVADVTRVLRIREDKPALQNLLQKGSVGDELWNSLLNAEKELEAEITEVVTEANSFVEGWGQVIFQTANEVIVNEKLRSIFEHTAEVKMELASKYGLKGKGNGDSVAVPSPVAPFKLSNGLRPSSSAGADSTASSDCEPVSTSTVSKSNKKAKKRK